MKNVIHGFSISNTFISNTRLRLAKNQAKAKKHLKAELLLFENYSPFSFKNNRRYSKKCTKNKYTCLRGYMTNDNYDEAENEKQIT